jgi:hypothetical protein
MSTPLYYIGTSDEVAHHARPLAERFDLRIVAPEEAVRVAQPGEVCVFFNEYFPRFREACLDLKAKGCPTLYAVDGILEWRNSWELPEHGTCCLWVMRPVLSHKVACIGRSQARILESWGNLGKCEIVGVPRFDALASRRPRIRTPLEPLRVLVLTAKCPGMNDEQVARTTRSLADLKHWFERHARLGETRIEPVWRLTQGLEKAIGVENQLADTTGKDLASVLAAVDAVVATPSTALLEGMLQGVPVAQLDYHNRPHYVPAAWRITAAEQFDEVLPELIDPSPARMLYQEFLLHDALECRTPATPRLIELIEAMHETAQQCLRRGQPLQFRRRMLRDSQDGHHLPEATYDHARLFPARLLLTGSGRELSPGEAIALAAREGFSTSATDEFLPDGELSVDAGQPLASPVGSRREWSSLSGEIQGLMKQGQVISRLRSDLQQARGELHLLRRGKLAARLARLGHKVRRLLHVPSAQVANAEDRERDPV